MFKIKHLFQLLLLSASLFTTPLLLADVININKATATVLQKNLKGIGEKKAQAIVAYRKNHGAFKTLDEIMEVKGIGEGIFKKIKANISLDKGIAGPVGKATAQSSGKTAVKKAKAKKKAVKATKKDAVNSVDKKSKSSAKGKKAKEKTPAKKGKS